MSMSPDDWNQRVLLAIGHSCQRGPNTESLTCSAETTFGWDQRCSLFAHRVWRGRTLDRCAYKHHGLGAALV